MNQSLRSRSFLRLIAALAFPLLLTVCVSCNAAPVGSGYMPIPPPNPTFGSPTPELDSAGVTHTYWKVTSPPSWQLSALWVYLRNIDTGLGVSVQADLDGSYTTRVEGQQDDQILFGFGAPNVDLMCRPLREGLADVPCQ